MNVLSTMNALAAITLRSQEFWPLVLIGLGAVAAAVLALYRPQVGRLRRPWAFILPVLRVAAVGALAISILKPVVLRARSAEERGVVLFVLDRSLSMSAKDRVPHELAPDRRRLLGQLVGLADALGRLPEGIRSVGLSGAAQSLRDLLLRAEDVVRAGREVDYVRLSGRDPAEAQQKLEQASSRFLADAAAARDGSAEVRPAIAKRLAELATPPRAEQREAWVRGEILDKVRKALDEAEVSQDAVDEELYRTDPVVRIQADELADQSRLALCWEALTTRSGLLSRLGSDVSTMTFVIGENAALASTSGAGATEPGATDQSSDIAAGVRRAIQRVGNRPVQAVVLFSDGREVSPTRSRSPRVDIPAGVPVFSVYAAAPGVRDLSVAQVEAPRSVFVGERMSLKVHGRMSGVDPAKLNGDVTVTFGEGQSLSAPLVVRERRLEPVTLADREFRLQSAGASRLTIDLPVVEREVTNQNNRVERWVKVLAQRLRVTVISSAPTWDFRYLRDALGRSQWVELRQAVIPPGSAAPAIPPEELLGQDLVILCDVRGDTLLDQQWDALHQLVRERGGSVLIIPGLGHLRSQLGGKLNALLPYRSGAVLPAWKTWPGRSARFHAVPSATAEDADVLRLDDPPQASRRRWEELPGFYRYLSIPRLRSDVPVRTLLVESDSGDPLLMETRLGAGRSLLLATDETWRWRLMAGDRDHERFWLQLVRYAAGEPYALSQGPLALDVDRVVINPGDTVQVRARVFDHTQTFPAQLDLSIWQGAEFVRSVVMGPVGAEADGRYAVMLGNLPDGEYALTANYVGALGASTELTMPLKVERSAEAELADLSGDEAFLRTLSEQTGGKFLYLDQIASLPGLLEESRQRQPAFSELRLWDSGWLYLFVFSCFTAEWALRKRVGLA